MVARINIKDLPKDLKITQEEMKKLKGGRYLVGPLKISYKSRFIEPIDGKFIPPLW
jgi:hypothetical protein